MVIARAHLTLKEFLAQPEQKPALEYIAGEVTEKMPPVTEHIIVQLQFRDLVDGFARPGNLARAFPELRETYAETSTIPDVSVFTWARLPRKPGGGWLNDVREPPDITFEILSPGQSATDLLVRCLWYVANGVRVALYADPSRRVVIAFRPGAEPVALVEQGALPLDDVIAGFSLDVAALFAPLDPDWSPAED